MQDEKIANWTHSQLIIQARVFRKNPTTAEALLWFQLRKKHLNGLKVHRQHVMHTFIVDFYCPAAKLIVEVDGPIHQDQVENDKEREEYLQALGYHIIRFSNDEVIQNIELVLTGIYDACMRRIDSFNSPPP